MKGPNSQWRAQESSFHRRSKPAGRRIDTEVSCSGQEGKEGHMKQVSKYVSAGESKKDGKKRKEPYGGLRRSFSMSGVPGEGDNPYLEGME